MIPDGYELSAASDRNNKWKQFSLLSPISSVMGKIKILSQRRPRCWPERMKSRWVPESSVNVLSTIPFALAGGRNSGLQIKSSLGGSEPKSFAVCRNTRMYYNRLMKKAASQ
jgi:hypothetical protein